MSGFFILISKRVLDLNSDKMGEITECAEGEELIDYLIMRAAEKIGKKA